MAQQSVPGQPTGLAAPVQQVIDTLATWYPEARYALNFSTPLELLVATILAAQCTDERVNAVTRDLFQKYRGARAYATARPEELEEDIHSTGFYRNKAKSIRAACQYLLDHHDGDVPRTLKELVQVPGVARKTANVVLGNAFGIVEGFIVDTHVARLAVRLGWTHQEDAVKIEQELLALVPQPQWLHLAHRLILHGRAICTARKPACGRCPLADCCPSVGKV